MPDIIFTIGHSTHALERFIELLNAHGIEAVYDVRSAPYSRHNPQYNREALRAALARQGIAYVFAGDRLGARSDNPAHYVDGKVQYDRLAASDAFKNGIDAVCEGAARQTIALMCAEKDPMQCHRAILVCRHLRGRIADIEHIREDGRLESQEQLEGRLMPRPKVEQLSFLDESAPDIEMAYARQGNKIAYNAQQSTTTRRDSDDADYLPTEADA